jgi:uncharacterized protein (DUF2252 family)
VYAVANLVSNESAPVLSLASKWSGKGADVVVNARVALAPESLEPMVRAAINDEAVACGASADVHSLQCFRPGRPVPTHRLNP